MTGYTSSKPGCSRAAGAHASTAVRMNLSASSMLCWSSHIEYCTKGKTTQPLTPAKAVSGKESIPHLLQVHQGHRKHLQIPSAAEVGEYLTQDIATELHGWVQRWGQHLGRGEAGAGVGGLEGGGRARVEVVQHGGARQRGQQQRVAGGRRGREEQRPEGAQCPVRRPHRLQRQQVLRHRSLQLCYVLFANAQPAHNQSPDQMTTYSGILQRCQTVLGVPVKGLFFQDRHPTYACANACPEHAQNTTGPR